MPAKERPSDEKELPLKIMAAPEAALKAFLSAPDWQARVKHVMRPDETVVVMESYYTEIQDGPVAVRSIKPHGSHGDEDGETDFYTYLVTTDQHPEGFPVAVFQTEEGWKVDWGSFVELNDDHFNRFAGGQGGDTGAFHLLVRVTHFASPAIEGFTAFRVEPPLANRDRYAFARTGSDLHKMLAASSEPGRPAFPVLQLKRHPAEGGKNWLEITAILAPNWWPESE